MSGTATNGTDFTAIPTTVTFAAGSATALVNLTVVDDSLVEGTETATLTVQTGTGYTPGGPAATITIADNDPAVTVVATDANAGEPANNGLFTLTRTGPTASALTVNVAMSGTATNGTDFTAIPTTVTFAAGSATALVNLTVVDDSLVEGTETATLTVQTGTGYTPGGPAATITIADNDLPAVTLAANYSGVSENGTTNLIYTFTRTGANTNALNVNYAVVGTATPGTDYSGIAATTATVTFAANSSTATVTVDPIADTTIEANETVVLTLATGTDYTIGTPGPVTTTILNDDGVINQQGTLGNDVIEAGTSRILSARAGNDILIGSNLADTFAGGSGSDIITSGFGFDTVSYSLASEGGDTITDFNVLEDIIQVSASGFGGGLIAGEVIDSSQFQLGSAATTSSHRFIYTQATGQLYFDIDGTGSTVQTLLATLTPGTSLNHQHIFAA